MAGTTRLVSCFARHRQHSTFCLLWQLCHRQNRSGFGSLAQLAQLQLLALSSQFKKPCKSRTFKFGNDEAHHTFGTLCLRIQAQSPHFVTSFRFVSRQRSLVSNLFIPKFLTKKISPTNGLYFL